MRITFTSGTSRLRNRASHRTCAELAGRGDLVAIVGAGGKTSTLFTLAAAPAERGARIPLVRQNARRRASPNA